jgi:8-oxo-dGTP pyrophosphatase MutT (NUDIX family)
MSGGNGSGADIFARTYRLPDGSVRPDYLVVEERSGTLVVPLTEANEVLLVRQYRPPVRDTLWELAAGALEPGDQEPQQRAAAELDQDTGYTAAVWHSLGTFHAAPTAQARRTTVSRARRAPYRRARSGSG